MFASLIISMHCTFTNQATGNEGAELWKGFVPFNVLPPCIHCIIFIMPVCQSRKRADSN